MRIEQWNELERAGMVGDQVERDNCKGISAATRARQDAEDAARARRDELSALATLAGQQWPAMRRPIR